ncbi:MAG: hypothetical protein ABJE47_09235 [bacterium]
MRPHLALLCLLAACAGGTTPAVAPVPAPLVAAPAVVASAPASFVRSNAEPQVTRNIDVRDGLSHTQAMRIVNDALGQRYTVDVVDAKAGFVMTAWQASLTRNGVPDLHYRTRLTARFMGDDWRKLQVRGEANWARGDEWDVGFDAVQLDSASSELRAKLGRNP